MALEQRQFGRSAELIIGPKFTGSNGLIEPPISKIFKTRIKFKIEKTDEGGANKGKISIYNLNEDSRTFIEKENNVLILRVGYGDNLSTLFFGDLAKNGVHTKRSGADIVTTLEAGDAEKVLRETHIELGLRPGATNIQILALAVAKLKLATGVQIGFTPFTYVNGFSFSGKISELLNQLTRQIKVNWSIQDGELQILPENQTEPGRIVFLSPSTGLIGTPTKTKDIFEFMALINPAIRPGKKVFIESQIALGGKGATVKAKKCVFNGDTHGGRWEVKVEGAIL